MNIPVACYFILSALLFFIGVFGFVTRRNLIAMLISVELILNAVDLNFARSVRRLFLYIIFNWGECCRNSRCLSHYN